jgi:VanZ like family/Concanavalin A-like lectin/glucanases superfamily
MQRIEPANNGLKFCLVVISVIVLSITLSAGLWPFSFHQDNNVKWNVDRAGLHFGDHGMIVSRGKFEGLPTDASKGCTLELWVEPGLSSGSSTILSFYNPQSSSRMQLQQSSNDLAFIHALRPPYNRSNQQSVFLDHVLKKGEKILITLAYANGVLDVYLDGSLRKSTRTVEMPCADFAGTLIVGNTPYKDASWTGIVYGLAFYDHGLRAGEVVDNFRKWQNHTDDSLGDHAKPYSLYLFNERNGAIVHNFGTAGIDLEIPKHYFVMHPGFLVPFWREFRPNLHYVKDLAINVFGLAPLGFCCAALFAWVVGRKRNLLYAMVAGFCVSLTIEMLQAFIPTRMSGTTDLITNTSGAALGAWLYLNKYTQTWLERCALIRTT